VRVGDMTLLQEKNSSFEVIHLGGSPTPVKDKLNVPQPTRRLVS